MMSVNMMRFTRVILFIAFLASAQAFPQASTPSIYQHAHVGYTSTGQVVISATGTRPLTQILTNLRRHYGWVVDYEESKFTPSELSYAPFNRPLPTIRSVTATTMAPRSGTPSEISTLLRSVAAQAAPGSRTTAVLRLGNSRFSVTARSAGQWLLLDTPITLPSARRTIDATVNEICSMAASARGTECDLGGIVDGDLLRTDIVLGSNAPIQARQLLAQALDMAPHRKVWMLTYDPSRQAFVLGIEPAAIVETTVTGQERVYPLEGIH